MVDKEMTISVCCHRSIDSELLAIYHLGKGCKTLVNIKEALDLGEGCLFYLLGGREQAGMLNN